MTKRLLILLGFIALKFFLQSVLIHPDYELQRDEYLHLDQGSHLAWGYLSVPPFTSWTSYLIQLLGNSVFWIKFFPALYGALTIVVVWKTIEALDGNLIALCLGATGVLFSALLRLNTLYQPNSFDVLCWTTLYFILVKYIKTDDAKWLFFGAVVFALGFLNKYNIVFLMIGLVPALLLSPHRKILLRKNLYYAMLLGLLLILPNLIWQYKNDFVVFHHMKELAETQLVNVNRFDFLKGQVLFFAGSFVVLIASFYALLFYAPFTRYRVFFFALVFTLSAFLYFRGKDYYAIGIYPIYIAFGAVYLSEVLKHGWKRYVLPVLIGIPVLLFIPMYSIVFPTQPPEYIVQHAENYRDVGMLRWEDGKDHALPQDFADMLGWRELAMKVDSVYALLSDKGRTIVLCDNYGQAGAINYYTTQGIEAVSFNADYINWFDLDRDYQNLIRVKEQTESERELAETAPFFQQGVYAASVTNPYAREFGTAIFAFTGARIDIRERLQHEINEKRNFGH